MQNLQFKQQRGLVSTTELSDKPRTVLFVDDSPTQRALWTYTLAQRGLGVAGDAVEPSSPRSRTVEVMVAKDVESALELMAGRKVDVLITDIDMPGLSGWELAERAQAANPELKVLVVSSRVTTGQLPRPPIMPENTFVFSKADREQAVNLLDTLV